MITSTQAKNIIKEGARELFPRILPSRLQEARSALLSHLNMREEDFGYFPSGGDKFSNYCSQVVSDLKSSGEMTTEGWTWIWANKPTQPVAEGLMNMTMFELFEEAEEVVKTPSLYDMRCEETVIRLVATTPCFGKVVQSDDICQGCPLFDLCCEKKGEVKQAKKEAREAREEALEIASQAGYDLKGISPPKSARVFESYEIEAQADTFCIASGSPILKGEKATIIPSWGAVKPIIAEAFKAIGD